MSIGSTENSSDRYLTFFNLYHSIHTYLIGIKNFNSIFIKGMYYG